MLKTGSPRIDAHVHFWQVSRGDYPWMSPDEPVLYRDYGPAELKPMLDEQRIDGVILVQAAPTRAETDYLLAVAERCAFVTGLVGWVDLTGAELEQELAELSRYGTFKGIRPMLQDIADPAWILGAEVGRGLEVLAENELVFEFLVRPEHLEQTNEVLRRHPGLRSVIDHAAKPEIGAGEFTSWAKKMTRLARDTRACCKISGLVTEAGPNWSPADLRPYVEHLLAEFGSERLIFGSDWPVLNLASDYATWLGCLDELLADLSDNDRQQIFGGNAAALYSLAGDSFKLADNADQTKQAHTE